MIEKPFDIDFQAGRQPFNTKLVLDLSFLSKIVALIQDEVLQGLVDTDSEEYIVIHINLDPQKLLILKKTLNDTEEPASRHS
jgi:hypothetical protein